MSELVRVLSIRRALLMLSGHNLVYLETREREDEKTLQGIEAAVRKLNSPFGIHNTQIDQIVRAVNHAAGREVIQAK